jgi:uncharacterized protein (TIGR03435 family)
MTRGLILTALVCGAAYTQSGPSFEAADVHVSPPSNSFNQYLRGPFVRAARYELRTATMLDLIGTAYSMDADRVYGGPNWLEMDRYDVTGKLPAGATPTTQKQMLQQLLADRFHLVLHQDSKELPVYTMTAGKHNQMKAADVDGEGEPGCKVQFKPAASAGAPSADGAPPPPPHFEITCRRVTMARFADDLRNNLPFTDQFLHNKPVVNHTGLDGAWDFKFTFAIPARFAGGSQSDPTTFFQVLEQQVGLKLEPGKSTLPVLQVDSVNQKPTANPPEVAKVLEGSSPPTEFEVASIKPTDASFQGLNFNIQSGGRVDIRGASLKFMIQQAWNVFNDDMVAGAPKWLGDDRWDIVAKAPASVLSHAGPNTPEMDFDSVMVMMKNLLAERFKLATHMDNREQSAYNLVAVKPKMKPADPNGRIKCVEGPGPDGKDPRDVNPILGRLITCQNMTMDRFADMLWGLAPGYIHSTALNQTGLAGSWDFTLSFSTAGQLQNGGKGGRGGDGGAPSAATDPNGALSLLDALQKELGLKLESVKRPVPVLVIDHVEQKPIEN